MNYKNIFTIFGSLFSDHPEQKELSFFVKTGTCNAKNHKAAAIEAFS
ncbi:hypothetical protein HMPREF0645_0164 [Hallella bergensis DSM 17361]|uniref:Uncharacterized protein n=1 Tax=Hallella bergensis DSM 17361 TaxID=585502 RepID=D1PT79_9BACT|nr:hypothetical protein HMPREF0645_0164 [Hallella bergensis DSM 17361]